MFKLDTKKLGKILKIILILGFFISIPVILIIPYLLNNNISMLHTMLIIYPNGLLMLGITYEFIKLFKSLEENQPFTYENVKILKRTGNFSFTMSLLWLIDLLDLLFIIKNHYINYIIVLIFLAVLFFGVGIALYILSILFKQATDYKIENDLTI